MSKTIKTSIEIATAEIGTREVGNNRGRRVEEYQAADNLPGGGYAWCASFVSWVLKQTGSKIKYTIPWSNSASCDFIWADARKRNLIRDHPQPGDVFLVRARRSNGYSNSDAIHTGFVDKVRGREFTTIEGNGNADGGREGHSVVALTRPINERYTFVRWADALPNILPMVEAPRIAEAWRVTLKQPGKSAQFSLTARDGRPFIATRDFTTFYGLSIAWSAQDGTAMVDGRLVELQPRIEGGTSLYPVRTLADHMGYRVSVDGRAVTVEK